jgi:hypothetical protein
LQPKGAHGITRRVREQVWLEERRQAATFLKLDPESANVVAAPFAGYWPRLSALESKGGQFFRADGAAVKGPGDLPAGVGLWKIVFKAPAGARPLSDGDVEGLRNLPGVDGTLRLEGAGVTDAGLARMLGFATFERIRALEIVDTPAGDATLSAIAALPELTQIDLTGTQSRCRGFPP